MRFLRSHFRVPIEIDASVTGLGLTKEHIERYKRGKTTMSKDRNFLIFDLDRPEILPRLEAIPDATIIATNPCFELWYLLHYTTRKEQEQSRKILPPRNNVNYIVFIG